jgi:hypothetical protein
MINLSTMKHESDYKATLMRELRARLTGCVALRHEDRFTSGIPDISVTLHGRTSWWEAKVTPVVSKSIQELTMLRLAAAGYARYVVWEDKCGIRRTLIVHPKHLSDLTPEAFCVGFDMKWLVEQIRVVHSV